ncbi:hypothetical protein TTHERM_000748947 (macronuclear) [Tetrahymena thermophila SB210]|uniref:Uncharacterized protein n=1 Tax=Tetrahymena thermophila (strain SB210) TaxID=312017 RepID=W7XC72_TETTS|nr:hypothetical protein TTHERM_000748947 [Tetrahymena thermophila SB210]EWS75007.1 hypothetical protein TTHERM_000748947 [Tetrahymena thermophila SB210]|eukprot:XP_012652465.1 hypothetical protein TTHERM_000748947 [Tetrahymena thermophila SB210]
MTYNFNKQLNITVYQIDLTNQSIQKINSLSDSNCYSFKIIQKFSSLQDELVNNYFIDQIIIVENFNNLKIYDLKLSLIYQSNQLLIQYILYTNRVSNDDKTYVLIGQNEFLLLNIQNNNQIFTKLDFQYRQESQIYEAEQKINGQNTFYSIKFFSDNKIYEYNINMQRNLTNITRIDQMKNVSKYPFFKKNIRKSLNFTFNYFSGDSTGLLLASLSPKSKFTQLIQIGQNYISQIIQIQQLGIILKMESSKDLSYFDMYTNKVVQLPNTKGNQNIFIKQNTVIVSKKRVYINNELYDNLILIDLSQNNAVLTFQNKIFLNGFIYDENDQLIYAYGDSILILNLHLQLVYTIQDQKYQQTSYQQCQTSQDYLICLQQYQRQANINEYEIFIFHKTLKNFQKVYLGQVQKMIYMDVDTQYQNIFIRQVNLQIYSFQGQYKQAVQKQIEKCLFQPSMMICESQKKLLLIDRLSLVLTELGVPEDDSSCLKYIYIDFLNYLLFQTTLSTNKISVN